VLESRLCGFSGPLKHNGQTFLGDCVANRQYKSGFNLHARKQGRHRLFTDLMIKIDSYQYLPLYDKKFVVGIVSKKISERINNNGEGD
jgi:hypothetical protein